jgi:hypothetical protein
LLVGSGCGGDDDNGGSGGGTGTGGSSGGSCSSDIVSNHGHALSVSAADVSAATDKTYSIMGGGAHDHQVTLTASHFATLAGGGSVTVTSTDASAHNHSVTVTCT